MYIYVYIYIITSLFCSNHAMLLLGGVMSTGASSGGCSTMADASGTTLSDGSCHSCTCHATKHHAHAHAHARACMHA